jgi:hypothetical protein
MSQRTTTLQAYRKAREIRRDGAWFLQASEADRQIVRDWIAEGKPSLQEIAQSDARRGLSLGPQDSKRIARRAAILAAAARGERRPNGSEWAAQHEKERA